MTDNLQIYARQMDVSTFYDTATLVLNLSDKSRFIETFGMTALEAMTAGLPVIVPTVGGIAEMVDDGKNVYKIDVQELDSIAECMEAVLSNEDAYLGLAQNALKYSEKFSEKEMLDSIAEIIG